MNVCTCGNTTTAGCEHTNRMRAPKPGPHTCPLPPTRMTQTWMARPDWTCGVCGRVFRLSGYGWWQEVQGPTHSKGAE